MCKTSFKYQVERNSLNSIVRMLTTARSIIKKIKYFQYNPSNHILGYITIEFQANEDLLRYIAHIQQYQRS